ncbi:MmcQ/YjbR family DNA-binding protein [Nocardioides solisilvae]|uniref:MmcQ/YjbR family DNA-binding protein n=1 Tax=Nocardioides solisilvae TaxID=1542435 RepID=UPI000D742900|nr:MmcQ/YjbR family DNA-binding protein [Nocardioides solisilvae]
MAGRGEEQDDGSRPARPEDVEAICGALPETELGVTWGDVPTWKVPRGEKGRGFLLYRHPHPSAVDPATGEEYDDLLVVVVADEGEKAALVDDPGTPFFTIDHFRRTHAVLVQQSRLGELTLAELREVLTEAWACRAPKRLVADLRAGGLGG